VQVAYDPLSINIIRPIAAVVSVFSPSPGEYRGRPAVLGIGPTRRRSPSGFVRTDVRAGAGASDRGCVTAKAVVPQSREPVDVSCQILMTNGVSVRG
jgi:hypothetical protein